MADAPLFARLLSLPCDSRYGAFKQSPQQIKEQTPEALVGQLLRLAEHHPVLFLFEDAYWIDPTRNGPSGDFNKRGFCLSSRTGWNGNRRPAAAIMSPPCN